MSRKKDPRLSDPMQVRLFTEDLEMVKELAAQHGIKDSDLVRQLAKAGIKAIRENKIVLKTIADQITFEAPSSNKTERPETFSVMEDKPVRKAKPGDAKSFLPMPPP